MLNTPTKLGLYPKYEPQISRRYYTYGAYSTGPLRYMVEMNPKFHKGKVDGSLRVYRRVPQAYDLGNGGTGVAHTHIFVGDNRIFPMSNSSMSLLVTHKTLTNVFCPTRYTRSRRIHMEMLRRF